jgi:hypothetical protein
MTILANKLAAAAVPAKQETILARKRAETPRGEYCVMPLFGRVWVELAGGIVLDEVESGVYAAMDEKKLAPTALNMRSYDQCRTALTLAWAVRNPDPDKREERAGTSDEWRALDVDLQVACGLVYDDVRERLSPVGMSRLSQDQLDAIRLGIEKKNRMLLVSAGVAALSLYLLTMDAPPASSPTMQSSTGESQ